MKKLNKINRNIENTIETYACSCNCACECFIIFFPLDSQSKTAYRTATSQSRQYLNLSLIHI